MAVSVAMKNSGVDFFLKSKFKHELHLYHSFIIFVHLLQRRIKTISKYL